MGVKNQDCDDGPVLPFPPIAASAVWSTCATQFWRRAQSTESHWSCKCIGAVRLTELKCRWLMELDLLFHHATSFLCLAPPWLSNWVQLESCYLSWPVPTLTWFHYLRYDPILNPLDSIPTLTQPRLAHTPAPLSTTSNQNTHRPKNSLRWKLFLRIGRTTFSLKSRGKSTSPSSFYSTHCQRTHRGTCDARHAYAHTHMHTHTQTHMHAYTWTAKRDTIAKKETKNAHKKECYRVCMYTCLWSTRECLIIDT